MERCFLQIACVPYAYINVIDLLAYKTFHFCRKNASCMIILQSSAIETGSFETKLREYRSVGLLDIKTCVTTQKHELFVWIR